MGTFCSPCPSNKAPRSVWKFFPCFAAFSFSTTSFLLTGDKDGLSGLKSSYSPFEGVRSRRRGASSESIGEMGESWDRCEGIELARGEVIEGGLALLCEVCECSSCWSIVVIARGGELSLVPTGGRDQDWRKGEGVRGEEVVGGERVGYGACTTAGAARVADMLLVHR